MLAPMQSALKFWKIPALGEKGIALRLITLNYCWFGAIADLFYMDKRFDGVIAKRGFVNTETRDNQGK